MTPMIWNSIDPLFIIRDDYNLSTNETLPTKNEANTNHHENRPRAKERGWPQYFLDHPKPKFLLANDSTFAVRVGSLLESSDDTSNTIIYDTTKYRIKDIVAGETFDLFLTEEGQCYLLCEAESSSQG